MITNIPHSSELTEFQQFDTEFSTLTISQIKEISDISKSYNFSMFICNPNKKIIDDNLNKGQSASILYHGIDKRLYSVDIDESGNKTIEETDFEIEHDQLKIEMMKLYQLSMMDDIDDDQIEKEEPKIILEP